LTNSSRLYKTYSRISTYRIQNRYPFAGSRRKNRFVFFIDFNPRLFLYYIYIYRISILYSLRPTGTYTTNFTPNIPRTLTYNRVNYRIRTRTAYLDSRLGQASLSGQSFAGAHARVVALVEFPFQFVELVRAERGPVAPELWLFRPAATAHTVHVVFAVHAAGPSKSVAYKYTFSYSLRA